MKKLIQSVLAILLLSLMVACGNQKGSQGSSSKVEEIKEKNVLVLGTSADLPPMEWIIYNGTQEEFVGVDIEIAKAIAEELGVELEIKNMGFEGLLNSLNAGDVDIVLAGMVATPERKEAVDFTQEYEEGKQVLLVRKGEEDQYQSLEDLKDKKIGAQMGTIQHKFASEEFGENQVTGIENNNNLMIELKNKTLDCLFLAETAAKQFALANPELSVVEEIGAPNDTGSGAAVKKGNEDLLKVCNQVIDDLKAKDQIQKWKDEFIELSYQQLQENE